MKVEMINSDGIPELVLPVKLSATKDSEIRRQIVNAVHGTGIVVTDASGVHLQESAGTDVFSHLSFALGSEWLNIAELVGLFAANKVVDGFAGEPLKAAGVLLRENILSTARQLFRNLGSSAQRVRRANIMGGTLISVSAVSVTGEARVYEVPAADIEAACIAIADDLFEPDKRFKNRHWIDGEWIDGESYLVGHARELAEAARALPIEEETFPLVSGRLAEYGPFEQRRLEGGGDLLISLPSELTALELDDLLETLRRDRPDLRVGLDDIRRHIRLRRLTT